MSSSFCHSFPLLFFLFIKWTLFSTFFPLSRVIVLDCDTDQYPYTTDIFSLLVLVEWHGNLLLYFVYELIQPSFWFMRVRSVRQNGRCRRIGTKTTTASVTAWEIETGIMRIGIVFLGTPPLVRPSVRSIRSSVNNWGLLIQVSSFVLCFSRALSLSPCSFFAFFMPSFLCYSFCSLSWLRPPCQFCLTVPWGISLIHPLILLLLRQESQPPFFPIIRIS